MFHPFSTVDVAALRITWTESLYLGQKNGSMRYARPLSPWVHGQALSADCMGLGTGCIGLSDLLRQIDMRPSQHSYEAMIQEAAAHESSSSMN